MQEQQAKDDEGNPSGEFQFKENGALKAQELLGRHLKMFTDKVEFDVPDDLHEAIKSIDLSKLKDIVCKL